MVTITLSNGIKLNNLKLNGTNFVSTDKIDETIFKNIIDEAKVTTEEKEYTMKNVYLLQQVQYGDEWYFILEEKKITEQEKINAQLMLQIAQLKAQVNGVK